MLDTLSYTGECEDITEREETLSIRVTSNGYCFLVTHQHNPPRYREEKGDPARSPLDHLQQIVYETQLLQIAYKQVNFFYQTPFCTWAPVQFIDKCKEQALYDFVFPQNKDVIVSNQLTDTPATLLWGMESELYAFVQRTWGNPIIQHTLISLCAHASKLTFLPQEEPLVLVNLQPHCIDIVVYLQSSMCYANTFAYQSVNDAVYFILGAAKQQSLQIDQTTLYLAGSPMEVEAAKQLLVRYFKDIAPIPLLPQSVLLSDTTIPFDLQLI